MSQDINEKIRDLERQKSDLLQKEEKRKSNDQISLVKSLVGKYLKKVDRSYSKIISSNYITYIKLTDQVR